MWLLLGSLEFDIKKYVDFDAPPSHLCVVCEKWIGVRFSLCLGVLSVCLNCEDEEV